jgi:hypothetical protein
MKIFFYNQEVYEPPVHDFINRYHMERNRSYYQNIYSVLKKYEAENIQEADFAFAPINLIEWQFTNLNSEIKQIVTEKLYYLDQKPHIVCAFGDFGQRKRSIYESNSPDRAYNELYEWLDSRFLLLAFESTADLLPEDIGVLPWIDWKPKDPEPWISWFQKTRTRDLLFSFVGQTSYYPRLPDNHIRGGRLLNVSYYPKTSFIGTPEQARSRWRWGKGEYFKMLQRSIFTLCPAGYGRYSYRVTEALEHGSIPVILSDGYKMPLPAHLPWENVSLHLKESEMGNLSEILESVSKNQILEFQNNIKQQKKLFLGENIISSIISELNNRIPNFSK